MVKVFSMFGFGSDSQQWLSKIMYYVINSWMPLAPILQDAELMQNVKQDHSILAE